MKLSNMRYIHWPNLLTSRLGLNRVGVKTALPDIELGAVSNGCIYRMWNVGEGRRTSFRRVFFIVFNHIDNMIDFYNCFDLIISERAISVLYCASMNFRYASASSHCFVRRDVTNSCTAAFSCRKFCLNAESIDSLGCSCDGDLITIFRPNSFDSKFIRPSIFSFNLEEAEINLKSFPMYS